MVTVSVVLIDLCDLFACTVIPFCLNTGLFSMLFSFIFLRSSHISHIRTHKQAWIPSVS
jgi:hypothetical protein